MSRAQPLHEYAAKRRFAATPEPAPAAREARGGPLLFVVQQHSARRLHYDFRLECDGVLKSWAVPKGPSLDPGDKRLVVQTEDHPYEYASFEGVIPPGQYGAGTVIVWDCGVYSPDEGRQYAFHDRKEAERRVREGLAAGKLSFLLRGEKLKGSLALVRSADGKNWLLIKHKDPYAAQADITGQSRSVLSGLALDDLRTRPAHPMPAARLVPAGAAEAMPAKLLPMQAEQPELNGPTTWVEPQVIVAAGRLPLQSGAGVRGTGHAQGSHPGDGAVSQAAQERIRLSGAAVRGQGWLRTRP